MIAALDVTYVQKDMAVAAAVVFKKFEDTKPVSSHSTRENQFGEYIPGQFFKRELPCLLAVLKKVNEKLDTVIIDGYVVGRPIDGRSFIIGKCSFSVRNRIYQLSKSQYL